MIVSSVAAADPAALRLAASHGLLPVPSGGSLILGLPAVKLLLDRRRLTVAAIIVGKESPHVWRSP